MKINEALIGLILGIFSIFVFLTAQTFPVIPGQDFGAALFPKLIGAGLLLCSILLVIQGIRNRKTSAPMAMPAWLRHKPSVLRFLMIPASLVFYFEFADTLGFLVTAVILLFALFLVFKVRWPVAVAVALLGALVIHFMFYSILMVPLPWGVLETVAW